MPIGPYFADFVCRQRQLVVEVDGSQHLERAAEDRLRDDYLMRAGFSVLRVPSGMALRNRDAVCESIVAALEGRMDNVEDAPDLKFRRVG
jgi:very-short-patch-repair endonuclease